MEGSGGVASLTNPHLSLFTTFLLAMFACALCLCAFSFSFFFVIAVNSLFLVTCLSLSALRLSLVFFFVFSNAVSLTAGQMMASGKKHTVLLF